MILYHAVIVNSGSIWIKISDLPTGSSVARNILWHSESEMLENYDLLKCHTHFN